MPPAPPITIMAALSVGVLLDGIHKRPNERIIAIGARGARWRAIMGVYLFRHGSTSVFAKRRYLDGYKQRAG